MEQATILFCSHEEVVSGGDAYVITDGGGSPASGPLRGESLVGKS
jgi:hypothetical protein